MVRNYSSLLLICVKEERERESWGDTPHVHEESIQVPLKAKRGFRSSEIALYESLQIVMGRKLMYANVILFKAASSGVFIRAPSGSELNGNL